MSHRRAIEDKHRLQNLAKKSCWWKGAFYSDRKGRYCRLYTSDWMRRNKDVRWFKRHAERHVRAYPDLLQRSQYKKIFGFRYELF